MTGKTSGFSRTVVVLGVVSLLTDLSSEMIIPLVPLFLQNVLHSPGVAIGLIEGVAESLASVLRVFSGWFADRTGRPKLLTVFGYGISSIAKPFLALATAWPHVFAVRFADRFGKGIRSAPRDVIITEVTPPEMRGRAFGLHRTMDTIGAVLGPLVAFGIIWLVKTGGDIPYKIVFIAGAVPALIAVVVLAAFVPERAKGAHHVAPPKIRWSAFSRRLKLFMLVVAVFSIGNSSDAFLILRANDLGVSVANVLLIYVLFNAVSAVFSYPAGAVSDRVGRKPVILVGLIIFAMTYLGFALAKSSLGAWVLFAVYGLYAGLTAGVLRAFAADLAPRELRGTAIGGYFTIEGLSLLPASLIAGLLWDKVSHAAPFYYGAATAGLAALLLFVLVPRRESIL